MKKALVLGIGNAQVDLLRYLKDDGWWVIGCSYRRDGKGLQYVDHFELVNITDVDGVEGLARSQHVDLIYSIGSDLAMPTVALVASRLGLPTLVDFETANLLQNKVDIRRFLQANNISPVKHHMARVPGDLDGWEHFPAIVKPADNQGQRGVFLADSIRDIESNFDATLNLSRSGALIVEEYLDGAEVSVNAFVVDGEVLFNEVSDRLVAERYAGGIPTAHVFPSRICLGNVLVETRALAKNCIRAFSITNGPVYFQIKLTASGPKIIEITPRLDGCHMWRLIKSVCGVDLLDASVKALTGDRSFSLQTRENLQGSRLGFFLKAPGMQFDRFDFPVPGNASYHEYYYDDGEIIKPINGSLEKVGYYIE